MCSALFNSVGLLLDIVGVLLVFRYGVPPPDVDPSGRDYLWGPRGVGNGPGQRPQRKSYTPKMGVGNLNRW